MLREKDGLSRFFHSAEWFNSSYRDSPIGKRVQQTVFDTRFWEHARESVNIMEPMHHVLRAMDNESFPSLGSVHRSISKMKELIQQVSPKSHAWVHKIIDERWLKSMNALLYKEGM